jgi:hypothetical protein
MRMTRSILAAALILLPACQPAAPNNSSAPPQAVSPAAPDTPVSSDDPAPAQTPPTPLPDCPILGASDWVAFINAMPGPGARPKLIVTGKVRVATGGYRANFTDMRLAESYPVQIFLDLEATPPSGPATQAIETIDVRGEWPMAPPIGSVAIRCGNQTLARIANVEIAR